jgi:hypothetical protein
VHGVQAGGETSCDCRFSGARQTGNRDQHTSRVPARPFVITSSLAARSCRGQGAAWCRLLGWLRCQRHRLDLYQKVGHEQP